MEFVGLDTETISGKCRLIGLSNKEHFIVKDVNDLLLFMRFQKGKNFLGYNSDYDAQSMLVWLPKKELDYILHGLEVEYAGINFLYYRRKFFKFNNNWLFDCYQFYQAGTLDNAAKKYLGKSKIEIKTKIFTEKTIYQKKTIDYCIKDATLCYELFMKMYKTLPKELLNTKPISTAYYSAKYFRKELYENQIPFATNTIAREAYHGGLFIINTKGKFKNLYNYDIVSAYPNEICQLKGMKNFNVVRYKEYLPDADYGFYEIKVDIKNKFIGPLIYKHKGLCLNPVGKYQGIVTKKEYEKVIEYNPEIISAYHIYCSKETPFKKKMEEVFYRKCTDENKIVWKYLANSLYGRTAYRVKSYSENKPLLDQAIFDTIEKDGRYYYKIEDIEKSNFVYASAITANVRLRMYDAIKKYGDKIIAVQTDSLVSSVPLDLEVNPNKLGAWKLEKWQEAYMIGSGVYFYKIDNVWHGKFRGFNFQGDRVEEILNKLLSSDKCDIDFDVLKRISIQESKRIHNEEMANVIVNATRKLNINFDKKRVWLDCWKCGKELNTKVIKSIAIFLKDFSYSS